MLVIILPLLCSIRQGFRTRAAIQAEILALQHRLLVLRPSMGAQKVRLTASGSSGTGWKSSAELMKPKTVLKWHEHAFLQWWRWKSRRKGGRPTISQEMLALIRRLSRENDLWSAFAFENYGPRVLSNEFLLRAATGTTSLAAAADWSWRDQFSEHQECKQ